MAKTKKKAGKKPHEEALDSAHKIWLAGLGAMSVAEEEGTKFFRRLVEAGEQFESKGKKRIEEVRETAEKRWSELGESFDEQIAQSLQRMGIPNRDEIGELTKRVEELSARVEELKPNRKTTKKKA